MDSLIHQRVQDARTGDNPKVIGRVQAGWIVLGDVQFLPGYCLLLADPVVADLNALCPAGRHQFLSDMTAVGDALLAHTKAVRINYEILGNAEPALHAHIFPRYADEAEPYCRQPVWLYDPAYRASVPFDEERDRPLMKQIAAYLDGRGRSIVSG